MLSSRKYSLPIRNTVFTIGIAVLLRMGWHLIWGAPHADMLSVKGGFACLVLGWAIVDFFGLGSVGISKQFPAGKGTNASES